MTKYVVVDRGQVSPDITIARDKVSSPTEKAVLWRDACRVAVEASREQPGRAFLILPSGGATEARTPLAFAGVLSDEIGEGWPVDERGEFVEPT